MGKQTTSYGRPSVWNQRTDDMGKGYDPETKRIFEGMTGEGVVSTEQKKKGNLNKK